MQSDYLSLQDTTRAAHVAQFYPMDDAFCEPIAMTSAYRFASAQEAWERFTGVRPGNVYSRFTNPTTRAFEQRVAWMEHAEDAVAFASGMGAVLGLAMALGGQGRNVVCSRDMFGTTLSLFRTYMARFGVECRFVDLVDLTQWKAAIDARTAFALLETPSNPLLKVGDIQAIAALAHGAGSRLVVDNTMLSPVFQKPLELGADVVVHSAGKYMDGQGRCVAGVVACERDLADELRGVQRTLGICLSPMNAWLLLKSLETLDVRMRRAAENALQLAVWLEAQARVTRVWHTGLASHPQHALASAQQRGHGALLSFAIDGGRQDAWALVDALQLVSRCTNIGDARSMVTHPATTTHCRMSAEERAHAGISETLVRLSVGLEAAEDLLDDLRRALALVDQAAQVRAYPGRPLLAAGGGVAMPRRWW